MMKRDDDTDEEPISDHEDDGYDIRNEDMDDIIESDVDDDFGQDDDM